MISMSIPISFGLYLNGQICLLTYFYDKVSVDELGIVKS